MNTTSDTTVERLRSEVYIISKPTTPPGIRRPLEYRVERIYRDGKIVSETVRDENGIAPTSTYSRELLAELDTHLTSKELN